MTLHEETLTTSVLRPTYVSVDLDILASNYEAINAYAGSSKVMYILKANAYGHGLIRIAKHLESLGAYYFGVAYLEEGIMLREAGVKTPILVLGGVIGNQIPHFLQYDLTITASSIEKLTHIELAAKESGVQARAHLKIDTGMERIGVHYYTAHGLLNASLRCQYTKIEGIFTHLANADGPDDSYTQMQIRRFEEVLSFYESNHIKRPLVHMSNSGGMMQSSTSDCNMVRIGLLLYGIYPCKIFTHLIDVLPVLSWKTHVVFFKVIQKNHPVSYGSTWKADEQTRIITLPVGYGDGYMRSMSNHARVIVRGDKYNQVGSICMDQMMVNIEDGTAYNGDEVILIGRQGDQVITVEDVAEWAGTIPYEILTNINTRVPRVYISSS